MEEVTEEVTEVVTEVVTVVVIQVIINYKSHPKICTRKVQMDPLN